MTMAHTASMVAVSFVCELTVVSAHWHDTVGFCFFLDIYSGNRVAIRLGILVKMVYLCHWKDAYGLRLWNRYLLLSMGCRSVVRELQREITTLFLIATPQALGFNIAVAHD